MYPGKLYYFLILLNICQQFLFAQQKELPPIDSLVKLKHMELQNKYYSYYENDIEKAKHYAIAYLKQAKRDKKKLRTANGYSFMAFMDPNDFEKKIQYLDSAITLMINENNRFFPTRLYIYKGMAYDNKGIFDTALDCYLKGLKFAQKHNDVYFENIINHNIAILKRKLGNYDEAKAILKKCLEYESTLLNRSKTDTIGYLVTLDELIRTHLRSKEIDSAFVLNKKGFIMSKKLHSHCVFQLNQGILQYYQKDYSSAINSLNEGLKGLLKPNNIIHSEVYYLVDSYLYLGKSYEVISKKEKAIAYYKKIDSIIYKTNYAIPEVRTAYVAIINHYKALNDRTNQLHYINRLLHTDSILDNNFKNLKNKFFKEYNTPLLLKNKEKIIDELKSKNDQSNYGLILAFIIILIILIINYKKRRQYKIRFEELMNEKQKPKESILPKITTGSISISKDVVERILKGLKDFEENKEFTRINITSGSLASQLNTNAKYLTKVIKYYRKKNFSPYINDLRIEYIIDKIKSNKKLQNYTIKALATEAGFNSTEVFSRTFFKKTGIYPSYFIKKIQLPEN